MRLSLAERAALAPFTVYENGWLHGTWYCSTAWKRARLYGEYPKNFLARVLQMFPDATRILQPCAGTVTGPGVTVDISRAFRPGVLADVQSLPFRRGAFDLVIVDPPYGPEHAKRYGVRMLSYRRALAEFRQVLEPGGYLIWLDTKYPAYARRNWRLVGLIGVVTGFLRAMRCASIFERTPDVVTVMPRAEPTCEGREASRG